MTGFHEGELAVQARAGVREQAARLGRGMLAAPDLNGSIGAFLAARQFAVVSARDDDGRLWTSPLHAEPGFLDGRDRTLRVAARPAPGDPLHSLTAGRPVGMLAIDFANRRRVRVNGTVSDADSGALVIDVDRPTATARDSFSHAIFHPRRRRRPRTSPAPPPSTPSRRPSSPRPTRFSSAPRIRPAAPTRPTAAGRPGSSTSPRTRCRGRTIRATTCSTVWATSPSTPPRRCWSSTSPPALPCRSQAPVPSSGPAPTGAWRSPSRRSSGATGRICAPSNSRKYPPVFA
ncbi:Pyridoxamine 5''-phosphate oxidase [Mycolicibacterium phlei RIVM601174]|nr:Pyridoxamine 5''-phosphate oxidase [Mycolicibacterium phlei RIVM601174]MBF4194364.1 Pyridoxamine 5''-phosphate oxidase [Mycolicibacterium phlei]